MYFYLIVKKGYLQTFPWVFGGLSHRNLSIAQGFARRILQMKQAISLGDRVHWLVLVLLFDARGLLELTRFSQGEHPSSLPCLCSFAFFASRSAQTGGSKAYTLAVRSRSPSQVTLAQFM